VAREAESKELYSNLISNWSSLHDLTGDNIVLIFSNCEENDEVIDLYLPDDDEKRNHNATFIRTPCLSLSSLAKKQTLQVNSLKKYFDIKESKLPCFVITMLETERSFVLPIKDNDFYSFVKSLIIDLEEVIDEYLSLKTNSEVDSDYIVKRRNVIEKFEGIFQQYLQAVDINIKNLKDDDVFPFDAYCCGQKMNKSYANKGYVTYSCASGKHGRFFVASIDATKQSYCSCDSGGSPMHTKDCGDFRLYYGCNYCGARYNIVQNGTQIAIDVKGNNSNEVNEVALRSLSAIWDDCGGPFRRISHADESKLIEDTIERVRSQVKMKRDFFVSYNKADRRWAKWIAGTLEENGYSVYLQAWDFRPGENFILKMHEAIKKADKSIIVLSQHYLASEYCQPEWAAIFGKDPTGERRLLIPVRVSSVIPDGLLANTIYIDLHDMDEKSAIKKLLQGVDTGDNPRKKPVYPGQKRTFPGRD
jgi:hypothetical protein